jgi:hypothetical protein
MPLLAEGLRFQWEAARRGGGLRPVRYAASDSAVFEPGWMSPDSAHVCWQMSAATTWTSR